MSDKYINLFKYDVSDILPNYDKKPGEMEDFDEGVVIGKVPDEKLEAFGTSDFDDLMDDPTLYSVVIDSAAIENCTIICDVSEAIAGDIIKLTTVPDEGYVVKKLTVKSNGVELEVVEVSENNYAFVMPHGDIDVECEMVKELMLPFRLTNTGDSKATVSYLISDFTSTNFSWRKNGEGEFVQWVSGGYSKQYQQNLLEEITLQPGEFVEIIGDNESPLSYDYGYDWHGFYRRQYFIMTGKLTASGDIMSLVHADMDDENILTIPAEAMFNRLFYECNSLVNAKRLRLPATTLTEYCYLYMFNECANLKIAPEILPATTLAEHCYDEMFCDCTSLTTTPVLPATDLTDAPSCYYRMFSDCSSLTTAPELPATTLSESCYNRMFEYCSSLTNVPVLPATTLVYNCYSEMFFYCTSLTTVPKNMLPATTLAEYCYGSMLSGCTSLKSVPDLPATTLVSNCYSWMFAGCTSLTTAQSVLPATTLADYCYEYMFQGCENLTSSPDLLAEDLYYGSYQYMFRSCSKLNHVKCLAIHNIGYNYTTQWLDGVASYGTFEKASDANWTRNSIHGIPEGWVIPGTIIPTETFTPAGSMRVLAHENIAFSTVNMNSYHTLYISKNNRDWAVFENGSDYIFDSGESFYLCGDLTGSASGGSTRFSCSGNFSISGNIVGLWSKDNLNVELKSYCGYQLFYGCVGLVDASELILGTSATTLSNSCYSNMFSNCTSLTTAPELPATTLAPYCYNNMFQNCTSLTTAPELPATTLAPYCYSYMFYSCRSLTSAPELPAITLVEWCYYQMFYSCGNLTSAPELPATTLSEGCYAYMFYSCRSLNYIKCLATDISASSCTSNWVNGVASAGTFVINSDMKHWSIGNGGIPSGWFVPGEIIPTDTFTPASSMQVTMHEDGKYFGTDKISTGQTLYISTDNEHWMEMAGAVSYPINSGESIYICGDLISDNTYNYYTHFTATGDFSLSGNLVGLWSKDNLNASLREYCGYGMFQNCDNLVGVNELTIGTSGTTLGNNCFNRMFYGCHGLTTLPQDMLPATTLANSCYSGMFQYCSNLTNSPALPATTLGESCYNYMFYDCSSLTTVPSLLPATTLPANCYQYMFYGCTSLTTAPELPATSLSNSCYANMFENCTSLTTAPSILPATTLATSCYYDMFYNCSSLTTAPELPAATLVEYCYEYMFWSCTNLNYIKCLATDISASNCTKSWVYGVASSGTFVKHPSMNSWTTGNNGIRSNWTVVSPIDSNLCFKANAASTISFVSVGSNHVLQYAQASDGFALKTVDSATTISLVSGDEVYFLGGFNGNNLNSASDYTQFNIGSSSNITISGNIEYMFNQGHSAYSTTIPQYACYKLFYGCTGISNIVSLSLSATTVSAHAFESMFEGCTAITASMKLPAKTIQESAYARMYYGCSALNNVVCLATTLAESATTDWLYGVAASGTFKKAKEMTSWEVDSASGIPSGWTLLPDDNSIVHLPLAYNGDVAEENSGHGPIIGVGSMTWDSSKNMYKFLITDSTNYNYVAKWEYPDDKKTFTASSTGMTLCIDIQQDYNTGNSYANWAGSADLNEIFNSSGQETIRRTVAICSARYNGTKTSIPLHRYAVTLNFNTAQIKFYEDGVLKKTQSNWAGGAISDKTTINYFYINQLQTNNTALSIWAKNLKIYDYMMTDAEVTQEYQDNLP